MFLIGWLVLILILSVIPLSQPSAALPSDKIVHFIIYGLTAIFLFKYFINIKKIESIRAIFLSIIISTAYGTAVEFLQYFVPHRSFSLEDIAANTSGAFIFSIVYAKLRRR